MYICHDAKKKDLNCDLSSVEKTDNSPYDVNESMREMSKVIIDSVSSTDCIIIPLMNTVSLKLKYYL